MTTETAQPDSVAQQGRLAVTQAANLVELGFALSMHKKRYRRSIRNINPGEIETLMSALRTADNTGCKPQLAVRKISTPSPTLVIAYFLYCEELRNESKPVSDFEEIVPIMAVIKMIKSQRTSHRQVGRSEYALVIDLLGHVVKYFEATNKRDKLKLLVHNLLKKFSLEYLGESNSPLTMYLLNQINRLDGLNMALSKVVEHNLGTPSIYPLVAESCSTAEGQSSVIKVLSSLPSGDKRVSLLISGIGHYLTSPCKEEDKELAIRLWNWAKTSRPKSGDSFHPEREGWSRAIEALVKYSESFPIESIALEVEALYEKLQKSHELPYSHDELSCIFHSLFSLLLSLAAFVKDTDGVITKLTDVDDDLRSSLDRQIAKYALPRDPSHCIVDHEARFLQFVLKVRALILAVLKSSKATTKLIEHLKSDKDEVILKVLSMHGISDIIPCDRDPYCFADLLKALYEISKIKEGDFATRLHRKAFELSENLTSLSDLIIKDNSISDNDAKIVLEVFEARNGGRCNGLVPILLTLCEGKTDQTFYACRALAFQALYKRKVEFSTADRKRFWNLSPDLLDQAILSLTEARGKSRYARKVLERKGAIAEKLKLACLLTLMDSAINSLTRRANKKGRRTFNISALRPLRLDFNSIPNRKSARDLAERALELGGTAYQNELLRLIALGAWRLIS